MTRTRRSTYTYILLLILLVGMVVVPVSAAVNLVNNSQLQLATVWTYMGTNPMHFNYSTAPDGTNTATEFNSTTATSGHQMNQASPILNAQNYTISGYFKKHGNTDIIQLAFVTYRFNYVFMNVNLSTGTITRSTCFFPKVTDVGDGWYRLNATGTSSAAGTAAILGVAFNNNNATGDWIPSYAGSASESAYIWGLMVETGNSASTYNATNAVPVANFTQNTTSGYAPLSVQFTDRSTPTVIQSWYWEFGDGTTSTDQNPIHIYASNGSYTVNMNATNSYGSSWKNQSALITASGRISTYPISSINNTRILPFSDTTLPAAGLNVSINITPGERHWAGFVIKPNVNVGHVTTTVSDLSDGVHTIPSSAIKINPLLVWHQASNSSTSNKYNFLTEQGYYQIPELLVNNLNNYSVDYTNKQQSLWVYNNTWSGYFPIDNRSNSTYNPWRDDFKFYDDPSVSGMPVPFNLTANQNQELILTLHAPDSAVAGNYTGTITITSDFSPVVMNVSVRVLPFTLPAATKEYGLYYQGIVYSSGLNYVGSAYVLDSTRYSAELEDAAEHGVSLMTLQQGKGTLDLALSLRAASSLPKDKIFSIPTNYTWEGAPWTNTLNASYMGEYSAYYKNATNAYGFVDNYMYGKDEPSSAQLALVKNSLLAIQGNNSKTFEAGYWDDNPFAKLGDALDVAVIYGIYNETESINWHSIGHKIYIYGYPQSGVHNSELYRSRYGFMLWTSSYDGVLDWTYQTSYGGNGWNDWDFAGNYTEETFAFATSNKPIDTIEFEGWREGYYDGRYADELTRRTGSRTAALTIINAGIAAGVDMSVIRIHMQDAILALGDAVIPTASFTKNATTAIQPGSFLFNDTSINTPTMWNWSFGDANWTNGTTQNVTHVYPSVGTYNVFLIVSNAAGFNQSANQTVTVTTAAPVASFTVNTTSGTAPLSVLFNDTSSGTPTMWNWSFGDGNWTNSTTRNVTYSYNSSGTFNAFLFVSNAFGFSQSASQAITVSSSGSPTPTSPLTGSCTNPITQALNTIGLMLVVVGLGGIAYTLLSLGATGKSNYYGGSFQGVNMWLIVGSILAILIGSVMLIMAYVIIGTAMTTSIACV